MTKKGMVLQDLWNFIEKEIFPFQTSGCIFNQYNEVSKHDLPNGDQRDPFHVRGASSHEGAGRRTYVKWEDDAMGRTERKAILA